MTYDSDTENTAAVDLSGFDEDFAETEVEERDSVPDGKYQVVVDKVEITTSKAGNPMLKWQLKIVSGQHSGRMLWRNNVIASKENLKWLKTDLHTAGVDLEKLSDLPSHLNDLLDVALEVTKRTRDENENIYLNRQIVIDLAAASAGEATDELMPF